MSTGHQMLTYAICTLQQKKTKVFKNLVQRIKRGKARRILVLLFAYDDGSNVAELVDNMLLPAGPGESTQTCDIRVQKNCMWQRCGPGVYIGETGRWVGGGGAVMAGHCV